MTSILIASIVILLLLFLGMPVSFSFLTGSLLYMIATGTNMSSVVTDAYFSLNSFALLAIPLFMVAGNLMEISGIAEKLIDFASALLVKIKGGIGAIIPVASMFFGALSGSGTATVAALSTILMPRLEKLGWDKRYTAALIAASGPLGFMIPPNMNAILFGVIANSSIAALFLATVIPGIIWGLLYIIINRVIYTKWSTPVSAEAILESASSNEPSKAPDDPLRHTGRKAASDVGYFLNLYRTFKVAIPAFIMPAIIFGGIYGGVFTPTEAGAVACLYGILAGTFIYRRVKFKNGLSAFARTGETLGAILIILPMVKVFTKLLVINGVPQMVASGLTGISSNKFVVLFMIVFVLFIAGFFLDPGVLIFVVTPLFLPTADAIGLSTIQLGVILFVAIGVGTVTPPMAMNLFVTSKASGVPLQKMLRPLLPFVLFGAIPILLLVTYVPAVSLWLPKIVMGIHL